MTLRLWLVMIAAGSAVALGAWFLDEIGDRREAKVREEIRRGDQTTVDAARRGADRVDDCYRRGGVWDIATGECRGGVSRSR